MLPWCFYACSLQQPLWLDQILVHTSDPAECKVPWLTCSWLRQVREELRLWQWLETYTTLRCIQPLALRWWGCRGRGGSSGIAEGPGPVRYRKILSVLKHVEGQVQGSIASFLEAVESFAMNSEGSWLKVAGG